MGCCLFCVPAVAEQTREESLLAVISGVSRATPIP